MVIYMTMSSQSWHQLTGTARQGTRSLVLRKRSLLPNNGGVTTSTSQVLDRCKSLWLALAALLWFDFDFHTVYVIAPPTKRLLNTVQGSRSGEYLVRTRTER